jgi:hypothetical protein
MNVDCSNFDFVYCRLLNVDVSLSSVSSFESNVISSCRKAKPLLPPISHAELELTALSSR